MILPIKTERLVLVILGAIQFTNIVDFMIMMPMGDLLQKQLNITPSQYGFLVASYGIAAFMSSFAGVFYLDRLDRKFAITLAYAGFMLGTASSAWIPNTSDPHLNYLLFIGTRIFTGLTGGLLGGLVLSIVGDIVPLERRGRAMAIVTIAFSAAAVLGVPLSLTLIDLFDNNWHIPFYGVSLLGIPIFIMIRTLIPEMNEHLHRAGKQSPAETIILAFSTPEQRNGLLFTVLLVLGQFTVVSFLTPYMINNVGLRQDQVKWIYLTGGACTVFSGMLIGRMVDKVGRFRVFTIFALLSILPVIINTNLPPVPLWVVLVIAGFFFIFISGRMIPANTISTTLVSPQHRAGYMSLNSSMMSLASGSSSIISGLIITRASEHAPLEHYEVVGYLAVGSTLLSLVVLRNLKKIADAKAAKAQAGQSNHKQ